MTTSGYLRLLLAACLVLPATQAACYNDLTGQPGDRAYVASIDPSSVVHGGAAFTLTVHGYGFLQSDIVAWQGAPKAFTFVSDRELTVPVNASDITNAGLVQVAVYRGSSYDFVWLQVK